MQAMIKTMVAAVLIISSVSAALARPTIVPLNPSPVLGQCTTDEGQGRRIPCSSGP